MFMGKPLLVDLFTIRQEYRNRLRAVSAALETSAVPTPLKAGAYAMPHQTALHHQAVAPCVPRQTLPIQ